MVDDISKKDDDNVLSEKERVLLLQQCKNVLLHYPLMQQQFSNVQTQFPSKAQGYSATMYSQVEQIASIFPKPDNKPKPC